MVRILAADKDGDVLEQLEDILPAKMLIRQRKGVTSDNTSNKDTNNDNVSYKNQGQGDKNQGEDKDYDGNFDNWGEKKVNDNLDIHLEGEGVGTTKKQYYEDEADDIDSSKKKVEFPGRDSLEIGLNQFGKGENEGENEIGNDDKSINIGKSGEYMGKSIIRTRSKSCTSTPPKKAALNNMRLEERTDGQEFNQYSIDFNSRDSSSIITTSSTFLKYINAKNPGRGIFEDGEEGKGRIMRTVNGAGGITGTIIGNDNNNNTNINNNNNDGNGKNNNGNGNGNGNGGSKKIGMGMGMGMNMNMGISIDNDEFGKIDNEEKILLAATRAGLNANGLVRFGHHHGEGSKKKIYRHTRSSSSGNISVDQTYFSKQ
ncbi:hypothetical protein AX774_g1388 [Zancudomyces culisetae]|nr:hypothetical protein AX774_g1388 [Zancudomyces culisetae]|eukprot:OMH85062.1 hypothetical protein AX774_g1388 [Zancudomyces culisetae]